MGSVIRNSWAKISPFMFAALSKKWRTKVRTALGSEVGRKGSNRKGRSRAANKEFPG